MEGKINRRFDGLGQTVQDVQNHKKAWSFGVLTLTVVVLLSLIGVSLPNTTQGETGSASPNRLWSSGAELNTTSADVEVTGTSGTASISSSTKRSGDYAYRANPTSSTGTFYKTWANSAQTNKFWFRQYIRIASAPGADTYVMQVGNGANGKISVRLTSSGTLQLRNEEDSTNIGSASPALSTNTWYRVEVYVDTTTLSSTDATLLLDGVSVSSSTSENLAAGVDRWTWGVVTSTTADIFFDDLAVNDSTGRAANNWPGEGSIVHMQPNADGDNTDWTGDPNDTNDYDDVDEVTPNGNTDFIRSQTQNNLDDLNLESSSSAGITTGDKIKLASVGVRLQICGNADMGPSCFAGDGDVNYRTRIKATGGGTTEESASTGIDDTVAGYQTNDDDSAKLNALSTYDLPGTSTTSWTTASLDTTQIGIRDDDSNSKGYRVTAIWLQVEYVANSGGRVFSSGFELNSTTAGMEWSSITGSPTVQGTVKRSGDYALQSAAAGAQSFLQYNFSATNDDGAYFARTYIRIAEEADSTLSIVELRDSSDTMRARVSLTSSETLILSDEDGDIGSASSALSTNTWYRLELRFDRNGGTNGTVEARIDGATAFATSSTRSISTGVARLAVGNHIVGGVGPTTGQIQHDDVAINKNIGTNQNTYPGEGSIIHLRPNADDTTNTAWTNGFANVDEVTPDDATTLVSETTSDDIDDYELDASIVGASDTVSLVSVGVRFRTSSATQEDFKIRLKDSSAGTAIESNTLSPAATTWFTNSTSEPRNTPLTSYTRPNSGTAWTDAELDTAQIGVRDVLSGSGTVQVSALWLLVEYIPDTSITISGTCDQYDQTTDCTDDGSNQIRVAINGGLQAQLDTVVDGSWSITGVTAPSTGDIITVFIDGEATDSEEAVAVTKYDGSGNVTGIALYHRHLSIGSDDNQTITNANLANYDNSASSDEDIFFDVSAGNDLTVDSLASYTDEELFILSGNTFQPASGGGADVTTTDVEIDGTWTADSNSILVSGDWQNDGTFSANTSTVTLNGAATQTLSGGMQTTNAFYNLTITNSSGVSASSCERASWVPSIDFSTSSTATNNYTVTTPNTRVEYNSGSTYAFTNIDWNGQASGTPVQFRNSATSGSWLLNVSGTQTAVSYVDVSRSNASGGNQVIADNNTNTDCENNTNWLFNTAPNAPTALSQKYVTSSTDIARGSWVNETQIKFTATVTDPNTSDVLQFCVEKDILGTAFSNTEDSCGASLAYSGIGLAASITISDQIDAAEYHWQARVKDADGLYSPWVAFNGGAESTAKDYGIDTTPCTYSSSVYDGSEEDIDASHNDGSLTTLSANWNSFACSVSGLSRYEYSIGTASEKTDVKPWTSNAVVGAVTASSLTLKLDQKYYFNIRAVDSAGNVSLVYSSNGQLVLKPTATTEDDPPKDPPIVPATEAPPSTPDPTAIKKITTFFQENAEQTNNTLAGIGALTTLTLLPTVTTTAVTAILQNIPFLNFLLTSWLPIRRRKKWGTIRDEKTDVPIAGVEIQLFAHGGTEPLAKYRTDQTGQYGFLVEKTGEYFLNIENPLYLSYQSDIFNITNLAQIISMDVRLQPDEAEQMQRVGKARRYMDWIRILNYFSVIMVSIGTIVSVYVFYTEPTLISRLILAVYAVIWSVKIYRYAKYRYYGLVVDTPNDAPISTAIVQLTGKKQGVQALVHSTITDKKGRFLFIVKPSRYSMIAAKEGYEPTETVVNDQRISKTIKLRPADKSNFTPA